MFAWYKQSAICYAYLSDIEWFKSTSSADHCFKILHRSKWFTRGWTLQELIAPVGVTFFANDWRPVGTKLQHCNIIGKITGIAIDALRGRPLQEFNVGERMSWAARRQTTRPEDRAYSLLGIFAISMPLLYGEGSSAFYRLQESILESTEDHTIFAWEHRSNAAAEKLLPFLASSPADFDFDNADSISRDISYSQLSRTAETMASSDGKRKHMVHDPPSVTSRGIKLHVMCERPISSGHDGMIALCQVDGSGWLCMKVRESKDFPGQILRRGHSLRIVTLQPQNRIGIYGARRPLGNEREATIGRYTPPLQQLDRDVLSNMPSTNALHLALRIKNASWCPACQRYVPRDGKRFETAQLCIRCALTGPSWSPDVVKAFDRHESPSQADKELSMETPSWDNPDGREFVRKLDPQLFILEISLGNLGANLSIPMTKVLLCCMMAMTQERRVWQPDKTSHATGFMLFTTTHFPEFLSALMSTDNLTPGSFAVRMILLNRKLTATYTWSEDKLDWNRASLMGNILGLCRIFAQTNEDVVALDVAEASFLAEFGAIRTKHPRNSCMNVIVNFRRPKDVVRDFRERLRGRPSVFDVPDFVAWLWPTYESWSHTWDSETIGYLLETLEHVCIHDEESTKPDLDDSLALVVKLLLTCCAAQHSPFKDNFDSASVQLYGEKRTIWLNLYNAVKVDLVERFQTA
jgi:hypothetical protein